MTMEETLAQVRVLTRQLPPAAKLRVIRELTEQLLDTPAALDPVVAAHLRPGEDPWDAFFRIGTELSAAGPVSPSATEDLIASRR